MANPVLVRETLQTITVQEQLQSVLENSRTISGYSPSVLQKRVLQPCDHTGVWIEVWSVARKNKVVEYAVKFIPSSRGKTAIDFLLPAWKAQGRVDHAKDLSPIEDAQAKWVDGVVSRTPGIGNTYRVIPSRGCVTVAFESELPETDVSNVADNMKVMRADMRRFYGSAPQLAFKFKNIELKQ